MPPSTMNAEAVMKEASSEARKAAADAISSGSAKRPIGTWTSRRAARSGSFANSSCRQGRVHRPGAEGVHSHALLGELHAELAGHRQDAALRGGVGHLRRGRSEDGDERGCVDHAAATVLEQPRIPALQQR